jgi:membrane-bound lytic murein transglycosylase D
MALPTFLRFDFRAKACALAACVLAPFAALADDSALPPTELAVISSTASATVTTPDPLGQLLRKLESEHPADSARVEPLVSGDTSIDLWQRIRRGFKMPELAGRLASNSTRWYASQPDYIGRMASRGNRYLFHIVEEIEKRGMPTELALLPFVESAMQPEAESHAKAAGLWQFIPSTGKLYQLEQNLWKDERRDVLESTRAALDYLQKLYNDFGDWHLALAAYNCGEGCVAKAIARNRARHKPANYASLRLPRETQYYVPKLQAIKNIVRAPQDFDIALPAIQNEPYFAVVRKTRDMDIVTAARLAEMPVDEFESLNPSFNRPVMVGAGQSRILLPADRADTFIGNLAAYEATGQALASWTAYGLKPNETLAQVAERAGISEAALREANRIPPRFRIAPGSTILIPRDETMDDIPSEKLDASFALVPEQPNLRRITYRVRRGDSLSGVARRWHVQADDIVAWNRLRSPNLFAGQRLNLMVATRAAPKKATVVHKAGKPGTSKKKTQVANAARR